MLRPVCCLVLMVVLAVGVSQVAGGDPGPTAVELTSFAGNPILTKGAEGEWDSGFVFAGYVLFHDGMFHMVYSGGVELGMTPAALGYATSTDGLVWTKYAHNPVLELDLDMTEGGIGIPVPVLVDDGWMVYFERRGTPSGSADAILRATAPDPTGPWTVDYTPVFEKGTRPDWDYLALDLASVVGDGDRTVLYYVTHKPIEGVGMATSLDGITWTRYNDPATTENRFLNSDPVFTTGESQAWDEHVISSPVMAYTPHGWEMFYGGSGDRGASMAIGYATSPDGIHWSRFGNGPIDLSDESPKLLPASWIIVDDVYYLYYERWDWNMVELAVATGTVTWE